MKKVLIVDDAKFIRTVYKTKFNSAGIDVELAEDGETAFGKAKETKPDAVLLDVIMPKKDGFEVLKEFQADEELKKIPVIVFSNLSQQDDIDKVLELGAKKYLPKDNSMPNQIVEEINKFL